MTKKTVDEYEEELKNTIETTLKRNDLDEETKTLINELYWRYILTTSVLDIEREYHTNKEKGYHKIIYTFLISFAILIAMVLSMAMR